MFIIDFIYLGIMIGLKGVVASVFFSMSATACIAEAA
jgi:hypothetical protein